MKRFKEYVLKTVRERTTYEDVYGDLDVEDAIKYAFENYPFNLIDMGCQPPMAEVLEWFEDHYVDDYADSSLRALISWIRGVGSKP